MQEHLIELSVGETFQVGEYIVTLLDVDGDQLAFEIIEDGQTGGADFCCEEDVVVETL